MIKRDRNNYVQAERDRTQNTGIFLCDIDRAADRERTASGRTAVLHFAEPATSRFALSAAGRLKISHLGEPLRVACQDRDATLGVTPPRSSAIGRICGGGMQMYVKYVTPRPKASASDCTLGGLLDTSSLAPTPVLITGRLLRAASRHPQPPRGACGLARAAQYPLVKILLYRARPIVRIAKTPRRGGKNRQPVISPLPDFIG